MISLGGSQPNDELKELERFIASAKVKAAEEIDLLNRTILEMQIEKLQIARAKLEKALKGGQK